MAAGESVNIVEGEVRGHGGGQAVGVSRVLSPGLQLPPGAP